MASKPHVRVSVRFLQSDQVFGPGSSRWAGVCLQRRRVRSQYYYNFCYTMFIVPAHPWRLVLGLNPADVFHFVPNFKLNKENIVSGASDVNKQQSWVDIAYSCSQKLAFIRGSGVWISGKEPGRENKWGTKMFGGILSHNKSDMFSTCASYLRCGV